MSTQAVCPCGCGELRSRKTRIRHLNGFGTKVILVAQQNKMVRSVRRLRAAEIRRRQENPTSQAHYSTADESLNIPINSLENVPVTSLPLPPEEMNDDAPFGFQVEDPSHDLHDEHPQGRINESLYEESGIWRSRDPARLSSTRPVDDESDSDSSEALGTDDRLLQELAMEDRDDSDLGDSGEDEIDAEPWQHGMSAIDALDEEFEKETARRGK